MLPAAPSQASDVTRPERLAAAALPEPTLVRLRACQGLSKHGTLTELGVELGEGYLVGRPEPTGM